MPGLLKETAKLMRYFQQQPEGEGIILFRTKYQLEMGHKIRKFVRQKYPKARIKFVRG